MFSPCAKNSASPSTRLGAMASAYSARWRWSGTRTMIRSASSQASPGVTTRSPSLAALSRLREPDPDVDPGVAQRQRVRMPLAAVAEHGDVPALDDAEVGTVVVENVCHCLPFAYRLLISSLRVSAGPARLAQRGRRTTVPGPAPPRPDVTVRLRHRCARPPGPPGGAPGP